MKSRTLKTGAALLASLAMMAGGATLAVGDPVEGKWGDADYSWDADEGVLTVTYPENWEDPELPELSEELLDKPWVDPLSGIDTLDVQEIVFELDEGETIALPEDSSYMFSGGAPAYKLTNVVDIVGLDKLDISNVTNMNSMFEDAESLWWLGLEEWDTTEVITMENMFTGAGLQVLGLGEDTVLQDDVGLWDNSDKDGAWYKAPGEQEVGYILVGNEGKAAELVNLSKEVDFEGGSFVLRWEVTLTYELDDAEVVFPTTVNVLSWTEYKIPEEKPVKPGYLFRGWDVFGFDLIPSGGSFVVPSEDTTLWAVFRLENAVVDRFAGDDRYETNRDVNAQFAIPGTPVFIATGENYADALSLAPAAAKENGSLFLTPSNSISVETLAEIRVLEPEEIYIAGGKNAISDKIAYTIQLVTGVVPKRFSGTDRYQTSEAIFYWFFVGEPFDSAFVATGRESADALSASSAAGALGSPVVLVDGVADKSLDSNLVQVLAEYTDTILIAGGTKAVNEDIEASLEEDFDDVVRLAGDDRWGTNMAVNEFLNGYFAEVAPDFELDRIWIATGMDFPDALSAATPAGVPFARLVLSAGKCIPAPVVSEWIKGEDSLVESVTLVGGTKVLSQSVEDLVECK